MDISYLTGRVDVHDSDTPWRVITLIVGFVVYDSALTVRQVVALALQNPLITVPVGLLLFILLLFANPSRGADEA
jgi:uncharacterized protein (DUF983 family)